jgi:hypothetical protein
MLEIKTSLDWAKTETEIRKLGNMLPMFDGDVKRILTGISAMVKELSQLEVEVRNTRSSSTQRICAQKVAKINEDLKQIQKFHLMSMLSNS